VTEQAGTGQAGAGWRRIATEEAFLTPEVRDALRSWAAAADADEPDQDFWDFAFTQDLPGPQRVRRQLLDTGGERLRIMDEHDIMFAIDYPYQLTEGAVAFMDDAPISAEDKHKIFHRNAERIFGIPPATCWPPRVRLA